MKANQKFLKADEAVSPVIGVILMVAITVVLAAVVFVLVSDLGDTGNAPEQAAVEVESNSPGFIDILLISAGDNAPYAAADVTFSIAGASCSGADAAVTVPTDWNSGGTVKIDGGVTSTCGSAFAAGDSDVQVVVTILGTVVFNGPVDVEGGVPTELADIDAPVAAGTGTSHTLTITLDAPSGQNAPYAFPGEYTISLGGEDCIAAELDASWADNDAIVLSEVAGPVAGCSDQVMTGSPTLIVTIRGNEVFNGAVTFNP